MNCGVSRRGHRRKRRRARRRGHRNGAVHRTIHFAEHRLQHVPIGRIAIQTYSNAGEGLRDLTNGLTLSGDSHDVRLTASALRTESSGNPGNGRCQVAVAGQLDVVGKVVVVIGKMKSVVDELRHDARQHVVV